MSLQDFATRSAQSGVVLARQFTDAAVDLVPVIWPAGGGTTVYGNHGISRSGGDEVAPTLDSVIKCGSTPSLKFTIPAGNTHQNGSGAWYTDFFTDLGTSFGANDSFWIQVRQRWSPEVYSELAHHVIGLKFWDICCQDLGYFGSDFTTSSSVGKVVINTAQPYLPPDGILNMIPAMYHYGQATGSTNNMYEGGGVFQNAVASCAYPNQYGNASVAGCFYPIANEWFTLMMGVQLGRLSTGLTGAYSTGYDQWACQLYGAHDGEEFTQLIDWDSTKSGYQPLPCGDSRTNYGKIWLFPYSTEHTGGMDDGWDAPAAVDVSFWYDELIVSSSIIAAPTASGTASSAFKSRLRRGHGLRGARL